MRKIFLDDERVPNGAITLIESNEDMYMDNSDWIIIRTYGDFVDWIVENGLPDYISFDHDLGDNFTLKSTTTPDRWFDFDGEKEFTGYDCAKWLVDYCMDNGFDIPDFQSHSANPVGRKNIVSYLNNAKKVLNK